MERLRAPANGSRTGRDHLEQRSRLKLLLERLPTIASILIIDDKVFDADVLATSLRQVFAYEVRITHVLTLHAIKKLPADAKPDLIFLDDRLADSVSAETSLKLIAASGYKIPIVVMSGLLTRARHIELVKLGVADVIHKDERNAVRLAEAIIKVLSPPAISCA